MEDGLEQNRSMLSNQEGKILENKMSQLTINKDKNQIQSNSHVKYQSLKKSNFSSIILTKFTRFPFDDLIN